MVEIRVPSAKRGDLVVMIPFLIDADQVVRGLHLLFFFFNKIARQGDLVVMIYHPIHADQVRGLYVFLHTINILYILILLCICYIPSFAG